MVVGAVGGSGTRVLCRILKDLGYYMGVTRGGSSDTIWFPDLLGWPDSFATPEDLESPSLGTRDQISRRLELFEKLMFSQFSGLSHTTCVRARWLWFRTVVMDPFYPERIRRSSKLNFRSLTRSGAWRTLEQASFRGWGWKEPISHFYLPQLSERYPAMRYIHVVRHGLDMGLTGNEWQYTTWAHLLGLPKVPTPTQLIHFWVKVNRRVRAFASENLAERFLIIRFEDLVLDTRATLKRLGRFLDIDLDAKTVDQLSQRIQKPDTIGRHKQLDLSLIPQPDLDEIRSFGYRVSDR